jgi:hypothetical protein
MSSPVQCSSGQRGIEGASDAIPDAGAIAQPVDEKESCAGRVPEAHVEPTAVGSRRLFLERTHMSVVAVRSPAATRFAIVVAATLRLLAANTCDKLDRGLRDRALRP